MAERAAAWFRPACRAVMDSFQAILRPSIRHGFLPGDPGGRRACLPSCGYFNELNAYIQR